MDHIFTPTSLYSLLGVTVIAGVALVASNTFLSKDTSKKDQWTFVWLVCNWTVLHALHLTSNLRPSMPLFIFLMRVPGFIILPLVVRSILVQGLWLKCVRCLHYSLSWFWSQFTRRERIQPSRLPLGCCWFNYCLPRNAHCLGCRTYLSLYCAPNHQAWPSKALLDCCTEYCRVIWWLDDVLPWLVDWKSKPEYFKLVTSLGLSFRMSFS